MVRIRKADFNHSIDYDASTDFFNYRDSEDIEALFSKITFSESDLQSYHSKTNFIYEDNVICHMPLDDIINACESVGYKGVIDIFYISSKDKKYIDDDDLEMNASYLINAIETIRNHYKDDYAIIFGRHTGLYTYGVYDDEYNEIDVVVDHNSVKCIDSKDNFFPYPYLGWSRYIYDCSGFGKSDKKYIDSLVAIRACEYRDNKELERVSMLLNNIGNSDQVKSIISEYKDYERLLNYLKLVI